MILGSGGAIADGAKLLVEAVAANELELQEIVRQNPNLLPVEELDLPEPVVVVGRETSLPSGAVDLIVLAKTGDLVLIEFKIGTGNPDFKASLAQLLHYGSQLWGMSYEEFERQVAVRYFTGPHCTDPDFRGLTSLSEAAARGWPELSEEEGGSLRDRLSQQLANGAFTYAVVAQNFIPAVERTIDYLNATANASFYGIELVRFDGDSVSAFEARVVTRPTTRAVTTKRDTFPTNVEDEAYRAVLQSLLDEASSIGYRLEFGTVGVSVRLLTPDRDEPISVAWLFPPGLTGWMGLTNVTLGFDQASAKMTPTVRPLLDNFVEAVRRIPGAVDAKPAWLHGVTLGPEAVTAQFDQIAQLLRGLAEETRSRRPPALTLTSGDGSP